MKPLKAIKALLSGLGATVSSKHFADACVTVGIAPDPLEEAEKALSFIIQRENEANAKLVAAAEALRRIECRTFTRTRLLSSEINSIHKTAQNAWRATQV